MRFNHIVSQTSYDIFSFVFTSNSGTVLTAKTSNKYSDGAAASHPNCNGTYPEPSCMYRHREWSG